jgi:OmcA/MtrC family decaheme c-type cytochrome
MKRKHLKKGGYALFCAVMIVGALLLIGCSNGGGSTGAEGPAGPSGSTGPTGPAGGVTATTETCEVCHTAGKIADIAVFHPDPTGQNVTISNITLTNAGGTPVVSFHAATSAGPVTDLTSSDVRFFIADLVPANTATQYGTWPTPYFERWANETSSPAGASFDTTNAAAGNYTYHFATGFADASTAAHDYDPTHTQRLAIIVSGQNDPATGLAITNNSVGFLDFVVPADGANAVALDSQRQFVTADACKKCHSPLFQQAHHADVYLDTRTCDICHSPLGVYSTIMQRDDAYLPVLIHQIHDSIVGPTFNWSDVTFPQNIMNCIVCHTNSGLNLGTGNEIDNWKTNPSAQVCGSCHTDVNFATGENHPGGIQTNADCHVCHLNGTDFSMSVVQAHDTTPRLPGSNGALDAGYLPENIPEFDVTLSITPPANSSYYVAGEEPEVRVTLTDHATTLPVSPAVYITPQDLAGVAGGGLNVASLYVYGPRAKAVPVLASGVATNPPTQEHLLFVNSADPQVTTNSSGFGYQLLAIPADMKAGTYMVRVRIGDYGRVNDNDYRIESTALINIQIGTATKEFKVAGNNCMDCHGTGTAPFHDSRHAVVFDTDQCLACHDQSGNFAIPLADRVHAVHSANPSGDIYNIEAGSISSDRDWSDVTYPQDLAQVDASGNPLYDDPRCVGCHSSGDDTYKTLPYMMPCVGCHTVDGDLDHMRQNGGPF